MTTSSEILDALNWRYATKAFDAQRKIPAETWKDLEASLVLTPSSYGMQPWKFLVIQSPELREQLVPVSWNQRQIADCSHFVVFLAKTEVEDADVDRLINRMVELRGGTADALLGYSNLVKANLANEAAKPIIPAWATNQCYIALGQLLTAAALLNIDACPMEGFDKNKYNEILGLEGTGYTAVVACPLGYRSEGDRFAALPKVRYTAEELVEYR